MIPDPNQYTPPPDVFYAARTYVPRVINYYRIINPVAWQSYIDPKLDDVEAKRKGPLEPPPVSMLQRCIDDGLPFIFALNLYPIADLRGGWSNAGLFESHVDTDGVFRPPPPNGDVVTGGHTVLGVGYDPVKKMFLVQNSWGTDWPEFPEGSKLKLKDDKMKGYFWMPNAWFEKGVREGGGLPVIHTRDFWVVKAPAITQNL
ncbi:hypothetical protein MMC28_008239 [Mycoblastus sanguinarius]|nr:hypothetical protein [Mycoblastus sanguinarius]